MKNILLIGSILATSGFASSLGNANDKGQNNIEIISISDKENYEFKDDVKAVFFLKDIDDEIIKNRIFETKSIKASNYSSEDVIIDVETISLGEYYVNVDGIKIKGELIGTEFTKKTDLEKLVDTISLEIETEEFDRECKSRIKLLSNSNSFKIGDDWTRSFSTKINGTMDYEGLHYGDFSEWKEGYYLKTNSNVYYLITNETYSIPNTDNTDDFRTSKITYDYKDNSSYYDIRDYGPKARNPEATISFSSSIGGEINSDGSSKIDANISASYTTIVESPKINDIGNMALDNIKIEFSYKDPWTESDPWYSYNKNQSMQNTYYVIKENKSNQIPADSVDKRTVSIVRDDFWPWFDKTVNFNMEKTITLDAN